MGHLVRNCWFGIAYHPYLDPDKKWIVQWVGSPETSTSSKPPASSRDADMLEGASRGGLRSRGSYRGYWLQWCSSWYCSLCTRVLPLSRLGAAGTPAMASSAG